MDPIRIWKYAEQSLGQMLSWAGATPDNTRLVYRLLQHGEIRVVTLAPGRWHDML